MRRSFILVFWLSVLSLFFLYDTQASERSDEQKVARQIDQLFQAIWHEKKLIPSELSSDAEFLRRVWLDLVGRIPPAEQVLIFLRSTDRHKRKKEIDKLLDSHLYVKNWAKIWETWLIKNELRRRLALGGQSRVYRNYLREWLEKAFSNNMPYDQMVRELLTAEGVTDENGATVFLLRWETPINMAILTNKIFSGICLNCILFHEHGIWTEEDFWGMVAFFARTRRMPIRGVMGIRAFELKEGRRGETLIPGKKEIIPPKFFPGPTPPIERQTNRREVLAKLLTSPDNKFFGKALVNRLWAYFLGKGFVVPLDSLANLESSHPEVLELLAKDFTMHDYDLKRIVRIIVNTKVYQLSSKVPEGRERDPEQFSNAMLRPMSSEQIFHSLLEAIGIEEIMKARQMDVVATDMGAMSAKRQKRKSQKFFERSSLHFMYLFDNAEVLEEGLDYERTVMQALFMSNSRFTNQFLLAKDGTLMQLWKGQSGKSGADKREYLLKGLFVAALSRLPEEAEKQKFLEYIEKNGHKPETYQDIFSVLLNSTEFLFNH